MDFIQSIKNKLGPLAEQFVVLDKENFPDLEHLGWAVIFLHATWSATSVMAFKALIAS